MPIHFYKKPQINQIGGDSLHETQGNSKPAKSPKNYADEVTSGTPVVFPDFPAKP